MSQKDQILALLQDHEVLTQGELSEALYGDRDHMPNIYEALKALVQSGIVTRSGSRPSYYSLSGEQAQINTQAKKPTQQYRDVSNDIISNESLEEAALLVQQSESYGPENDLITRCLQRFPENTDPDIVAMKIGLIDITNSTHLAQHKSRINVVELSRIIAAIPDIDSRIMHGDPEIVNEIARSNGKINLSLKP